MPVVIFSFRGWCSGCNKIRFFVKHRVYNLKSPKIPITSNNQLCGRCFKNIKTMLKSNNQL